MAGPTLLPVRLQPSNIRPIAYRIISKKHGLNIQSDALVVLTDTISQRFGAGWRDAKSQQFLEDVAKAWKQQDRGLFLDGPGLIQVLKELTKDPSIRNGDSDAAKASRFDTFVDDDSTKLPTPQGDLNWEDFFHFVPADKQPNFVFDRLRKQFSARELASRKLQDSLKANIEFFNQKYYLIMDRLSRDDNFKKASMSSIAALSSNLNGLLSSYEITLIKNVLGRDGSRFVLFGLLSQNETGNYILEDCSDFIELNLDKTHKTEGSFYAPGMFVILEGIYSASGGSMSNDANVISGCFYVSNIGQPPAERRDNSLDAYGHLDFMGIHKESNLRASGLVKIDRSFQKMLSSVEKTLKGHKIIMLGSNIFLDDSKIQLGLDKFFARLESHLEEEESLTNGHTVIVMSGSFTSQPLRFNQRSGSQTSISEEYKGNFDTLAANLSKFPLVVQNCKFLFIPGVNDPSQSTFSLGKSSSSILPQAPIPQMFLTRLERLLPKGHLILGWNPMRINYISQEIVLFRDDLMNKFKRNDLLLQHDIEVSKLQLEKQSNGENMKVENIISDEVHLPPKTRQARKLVKTLLDQGSLLPFLNSLRVVNPRFQHVMRIEPLPTTIALFDSQFESFEVTYNGCKVSNLGSLVNNKNARKLNYAEYHPSSKKYVYKELYF